MVYRTSRGYGATLYAVALMVIAVFLIIGVAIVIHVPQLSIFGYALIFVTPLMIASMFSPFYADLVFLALRGGKLKVSLKLRGGGRADVETNFGTCTIDFIDGIEICTAEEYAFAYVRLGLYTKPTEILGLGRSEDIFRDRIRRVLDSLRALLSQGSVMIELVSIPDIETLRIAQDKLQYTSTRSESYAEQHRIEVLRAVLELASRGLLSRMMLVVTVGVTGRASDLDELKRSAKEKAEIVKASLGTLFRVEILKGEFLALYTLIKRFRPPATYEEAEELLRKVFSKHGMR